MKTKKFFKNFFRHVFFNGLNHDSFIEILPSVVSENNKMMEIFAIIMTIIGWTTSVMSYFHIIFRPIVFPICLFLYIASTIILLIRRYCTINNLVISHLFSILQILVFQVFSILISTRFASSPNINGVIYYGALLSTPFLFISVPIEMDLLLCCSVTLYLHMSRIFKTPEIFYYDNIFTHVILFITIMCNWFFAVKSIKNIRNEKYIEKERDTDALTGLLTKQAGKSLTMNKLDNDENGVLFVVDMDNFKRINDTQGHLYGDDILIRLSNIIKENTRRQDVVSRFGGDEFVIFFPGMEGEEIDSKANNILGLVRKNFSEEKIKISCSIGAAIAKKGEVYNNLFKKADNALYKAKELGKNTFFYEKESN